MKLPTLTNSENGFAHVLLIAVIVVVAGVAGFVGYSVLQNNKSNAGGGDTLGTSRSLCGSGYSVIKSGTTAGGTNSVVVGTWSVARNKDQKKVCAYYQTYGIVAGESKTMRVALSADSGASCSSVKLTPVGGTMLKKKQTKDTLGPIYRSYKAGDCYNVAAETGWHGTSYYGFSGGKL